MKKNNSIYLKFIALTILLISSIVACTSENSNDEINIDKREKIECDLVYVITYPGTACCITGFAEAVPGETLEYEYHSNMIDPTPTIEWSIISGDITIVSGGDSSKVTVKFGDNFTEGAIRAFGDNHDGKSCSDGSQTIITKM